MYYIQSISSTQSKYLPTTEAHNCQPFFVDAQFNNNPPDNEIKCSGETVYFNWTYAISSPVLFVEWKVNGSRIAIESVATSQPFAPVTAYIGRLSKVANAQISLGPLTIADFGTYKAEVTYTNGMADDSNEITLNVYGKTFFASFLRCLK